MILIPVKPNSTLAGVLAAGNDGNNLNVININNLSAQAYKVGNTSGVSGTFTTANGKVVTVSNGIITSIV